MVKIISPSLTENPLAKTISSLGNTLFGDTLTPALKREQMRKQQIENFGIEEMAMQAENGFADPRMAASRGILAGLSPEHLGMFQSLLHSQELGARDPSVTNALGGIGKYDSTAEAFDLGEQNKFDMNAADNAQSGANNAADNAGQMERFNQEPKPAMQNGAPAFVPQGQLTQPGNQPILNENQIAPIDEFKRWLTAAESAMPGATPEVKRQWAVEQISKAKSNGIQIDPDGTVTIGGPAGSLTKPNLTKQQADFIASGQFSSVLDQADTLVAANPQSVGAPGNLRHAAQSIGIAATELAKATGFGSIEDAWVDAQAKAMAMGVKPSTLKFAYDPSMAEIETIYNVMAFQGVRAIGGQSGNDMSDRDFKIIKETLGDPNSWLTNAQDLRTRIKIVKAYIAQRRQETAALLGIPAEQPQQAPAGGAPAQGSGVIRTYNPATGRLE